MSVLKRAILTAIVPAALLAPRPLQAAPITLTGGTVQVDVNLNLARLTFVGDNFLVRTGTEDFPTTIGLASPFPVGTAVDLDGQWRPTDLRGGEAIFNGVHYDQLYFGFSQSGGTFDTRQITLSGEGGLQTVELPFTFNGFVTAFSSPNAGPGDVVFAATLVGSGIARAAFLGLPAERGIPAMYNAVSLPGADFQLEYTFSRASTPTPEPGTLTLLGAGTLLMLAAGYRRRSTRGRRPPV